MKIRISRAACLVSLALGLGLFCAQLLLRGSGAPAADLTFALGSGFLIVGLVRLLANLKMFASFLWGVRMVKRIFRNEARHGGEEARDYAAFRERMGGHEDALPLTLIGLVLVFLSLLLSRA